MGVLADRLNLLKIPVSIMSASAAFLGYAARNPAVTWRTIMVAAGVFSLSAGAATLNNYQDRNVDRLMERTRSRPIPSDRVSAVQALVQSAILICSGLAFLFTGSVSTGAPLAGASAVFLYNGCYTPMKKKTRLALLPGVLCGMLPPLVGWTAAGGTIIAPGIIYIMVLFGAWQIPHLWLMLLFNREDYRRSHLPTMLDLLSPGQLKRLTFIWTAGFAVLILFAVACLPERSNAIPLMILANTVVLPVIFGGILSGSCDIWKYRFLFHYLNLSTLSVIVAFVIAMTAGND